MAPILPYSRAGLWQAHQAWGPLIQAVAEEGWQARLGLGHAGGTSGGRQQDAAEGEHQGEQKGEHQQGLDGHLDQDEASKGGLLRGP